MNKFLYVLSSVFFLIFYINVTATAIEGTVTDSKTGAPILGVSLLFTTNPESSIPVGNNYKTNTDSSGHYYISDVKPGIYVIIAERKNYETHIPEKILIPDSADAVIEYNFSLTPVIIPEYKYGKISGKVTYDNDGLPVPGAYICAMPADKDIFTEPWQGDFVTSDSMGYYSLKAPEGSYRILCYLYNYYGYYQEYYDNTENPKEAKSIKVIADSEITSINFGVPQLPPDTAVVCFGGKVTDNNGNPLAKAYVHIELPGIYTFRYDPDLKMGTYTNESGYYKISFPLNKIYFAKKYIIIAEKEGFDVEFYKEKKNYYDANILYFDSSNVFNNIDFTLDPVQPEKFYSINGKLSNENGAPIPFGLVIATDDIARKCFYALSDSMGNYSIAGLPLGKYYVLFLAKGYAPEFYQNALKWEDALTIGVEKDIFNIDAVLNQITTPVTDSSLILLSGLVKSIDNIPLPGVLITVLNSSDEVIAYDITNANGEYRIEGLTKGNYNLQASVVNYGSKNEKLANSTSGGMEIINFSMTPSAATSVKAKAKLLPDKLELFPNHPNPFNPSTIITFALPKTESVILKVYNIIGQEIATLLNRKLNAGTYNIQFDAKGLGSGVYLYQLETGSGSIVKKMLLTR
jgi:protocatechuate 3,4-dioxygenase beta subunit